MSHIRIPRKSPHSPRNKIHSEQSKAPKYSVQRIIHESIAKRRFSTQHNSSNKLQKSNSRQISRKKDKHMHSTLTFNASIKAQIQEAKKVFKTKNTKRALKLFQKIYQKYPSIPEIPYFIGSCLLNQAKFEAALQYFYIALQLDSFCDKNVYIYLAICFKGLGKTNQAIEVLKQAVLKYPRFQQAHMYKAKMHMKNNQSDQAIHSLKKSIILNPKNQLAYILLGDNLKKVGKLKQCLDKYSKACNIQGEYINISYVHKMSVLQQLKQFEELQQTLNLTNKLNIKQPQIYYYQGILDYYKKRYSQATILFQMSLKQNIPRSYLAQIFKRLMEISIIQKDFFGAQHLVLRARQIHIQDQFIQVYYTIIEGINDLIKRKNKQAREKLEQVYKRSKINIKMSFLYEIVMPIYAFCMFQENHIKSSINMYQEYLKIQKPIFCNKSQKYNLKLCEGIVTHKQKKFDEAESCFSEAAYLLDQKIQPIFFKCINQIQKLKVSRDPNYKFVSLLKMHDFFNLAEKIMPKHPLFFFYQSLVRLYENLDACETIQLAIDYSDEDVSQYFFIHALSYALKGEFLKGLESMDKAIQIDQNIPQFFKERSKYYYILQRYSESLEDIMKVLTQNQDDQQAQLLLTFYYYLTDQNSASLKLLRELTLNNSNQTESIQQNKFNQFQQALNFRLQKYNSCGVVGEIIKHIIQMKVLDQQKLTQTLQMINSRTSYSQFSVYFMYIVLSAYYLYINTQQKQNHIKQRTYFETAIDCLFGALQQINYHTQQQNKQSSQYSPQIQNMLSQVKFNIIIANLLRICSHKQNSPQRSQLFTETIKFINIFLAESEDLQFIKPMKQLLNFLLSEYDNIIDNAQYIQKTEDKIYFQLHMQKYTKKVSNNFPKLTIPINHNKLIKTQLQLFYPQKLKFNIQPQFDQSFLFNFDIDKIESKLFPPWYKIQEVSGGLVFTENIRNQSVLISETQKSVTPLLRPPTPIQTTLKEKFRLDESVQRKLNKLIKKH